MYPGNPGIEPQFQNEYKRKIRTMQKQVVKKGYTLTVVSWENDGDHYQTHSKTVETESAARMWWELMQLCKSRHVSRGVIALGNTYGNDYEDEEIQAIRDFFTKYEDYFSRTYSYAIETMDKEEVGWFFTEVVQELLGGSEDYGCRVMDSCTVTYSPENIYLQEVKFE